MSNLDNILAASQAALEFHVHDVEQALLHYGADLGSVFTDHIGQAAYVVVDGALLILRELPQGA